MPIDTQTIGTTGTSSSSASEGQADTDNPPADFYLKKKLSENRGYVIGKVTSAENETINDYSDIYIADADTDEFLTTVDNNGEFKFEADEGNMKIRAVTEGYEKDQIYGYYNEGTTNKNKWHTINNVPITIGKNQTTYDIEILMTRLSSKYKATLKINYSAPDMANSVLDVRSVGGYSDLGLEYNTPGRMFLQKQNTNSTTLEVPIGRLRIGFSANSGKDPSIKYGSNFYLDAENGGNYVLDNPKIFSYKYFALNNDKNISAWWYNLQFNGKNTYLGLSGVKWQLRYLDTNGKIIAKQTFYSQRGGSVAALTWGIKHYTNSTKAYGKIFVSQNNNTEQEYNFNTFYPQSTVGVYKEISWTIKGRVTNQKAIPISDGTVAVVTIKDSKMTEISGTKVTLDSKGYYKITFTPDQNIQTVYKIIVKDKKNTQLYLRDIIKDTPPGTVKIMDIGPQIYLLDGDTHKPIPEGVVNLYSADNAYMEALLPNDDGSVYLFATKLTELPKITYDAQAVGYDPIPAKGQAYPSFDFSKNEKLIIKLHKKANVCWRESQ